MNPAQAYLVGLIGGDGCVSLHGCASYVSVVDPCKEFHTDVIIPLLSREVGGTPILSAFKTRKGTTVYRTRLRTREAVNRLAALGIPLGKDKTFSMRTPESILSGSTQVKIAYIRGWMDAEGSMTTHTVRRPLKIYVYPKVNFHVANKAIRDELHALMAQLGIVACSWNNRNDESYGIQIVGRNVQRYLDVIGFSHPWKHTSTQGYTWHTKAETMRSNAER